MAELELSAIARECVHRRIPEQGLLDREALACVKERNSHEITIKWRFMRANARMKLKRHYQAVRKNDQEDRGLEEEKA